jgi:hypothetical protein
LCNLLRRRGGVVDVSAAHLRRYRTRHTAVVVLLD